MVYDKRKAEMISGHETCGFKEASFRMITEGSVEDHEDVDSNSSHFELKSVARIISVIEITFLHNCLFAY